MCSVDPLDRVEAAFNKFDTDGNGYIDWEEFKQVIVTTVAVAVVIMIINRVSATNFPNYSWYLLGG